MLSPEIQKKKAKQKHIYLLCERCTDTHGTRTEVKEQRFLSVHHMGPREATQVLRLGSRCVQPTESSCQPGPRSFDSVPEFQDEYDKVSFDISVCSLSHM